MHRLLQRKSYVYTAYSKHYKYTTVVYAANMKQAQRYGLHEAKLVMGNHAKIHRDNIKEM